MSGSTPNTPIEDELNTCYVALWEGAIDSATARKLELRFKAAIRRAVAEAFVAGFCVSGEGWNGEYPYGDKGIDPTKDLQEELCKYTSEARLTTPTKEREEDDGLEARAVRQP